MRELSLAENCQEQRAVLSKELSQAGSYLEQTTEPRAIFRELSRNQSQVEHMTPAMTHDLILSCLFTLLSDTSLRTLSKLSLVLGRLDFQ